MEADGWGVGALGHLAAAHGELRGAVEDVADLGPVDEVFGVEDGDAGEIVEGGVDEVIVVIHAAEGGIGMEAGDDGVEVFARGRGRFHGAGVVEGGELCPGGGVGRVRGVCGGGQRQCNAGGEKRLNHVELSFCGRKKEARAACARASMMIHCGGAYWLGLFKVIV